MAGAPQGDNLPLSKTQPALPDCSELRLLNSRCKSKWPGSGPCSPGTGVRICPNGRSGLHLLPRTDLPNIPLPLTSPPILPPLSCFFSLPQPCTGQTWPTDTHTTYINACEAVRTQNLFHGGFQFAESLLPTDLPGTFTWNLLRCHVQVLLFAQAFSQSGCDWWSCFYEECFLISCF